MAPGVKYSVTVPKGLKDIGGSALAADYAISPKPSQQAWLDWQESDTKLFVWSGLKPSTGYTVSLSGDEMDRLGQKLGATTRATFTTDAVPPRAKVSLPGPIGTFNATGSPTVYVEHVNVSRLDLELYRLDPSTFLNLSSDARARQNYRSAGSALVRRWSEKPSTTARDQAALTAAALGDKNAKLPAGFYFLRLQSPESGAASADSRLLVVSRLGLTMKRADGEVLVWAADLTGGDGVSNLPIRIMDKDGKTLATGKTDKDGLLQASGIPMSVARANGGRQMVQIFAFAEGEGDVGVVGGEWMEGIYPYEFNVPWQQNAQQYQGYLYTDRPIYRPGQKVLFKGIVRADDDAHYSVPPAGTEVALDIFDDQGRKVLSNRVKLSEAGSFDGELPLSQDAPLGNYHISARVGDWSFGVGFSVAEYRKPEFEAKVSTERTSYLQGDRIPVAGAASYYFGQPLANAPVQWAVTSQNYYFSALDDGYEFVDFDLLRDARMQGDRDRTQGKTTTDAQGNFTFQLPADLSQDALSQQFTVEATLTDANNQQVSARTSVVVHKGEYYPGLKPETYVVRAGEVAGVEIAVVDRDKKLATNVPLSVSFYNRKWLSVKEKQPDGGYLWISKPEDTLIATRAVTTDATGKAKAGVEVKDPGSVRVVAEVVDPKGNRARSATYLYVYVSGSGFASWRMDNNDRVELVPDKKEYAIGDTARVLVPSPVADVTALITIERGKLLSYRLVQMEGSSATIEVPILAVVDASVLALADDNTRDLMDTFWSRRSLGVNTAATLSFSVDRHNADLARQSKGAGGGGESPTMRQQFPDTAFWDPKLRTDAKGEATVAISMPDSLTTWRATVRGATAATQVGSATVDTVTTKSLLLRPALPRFLLMGDHLKLAALLHNYTDREVEAEVTLTAIGVQPEDGQAFAAHRVRVKPGDLQRVEWPATVDSVPGGGSKAQLTLKARPIAAEVPGDAVQVELPVNPLTMAEVVATSGEVRWIAPPNS